MPYGGSDQISSKLRRGEWSDYWLYLHWCPACKSMHQYRVAKSGGNGINPDLPDWSFNGDLENPTFSPSMLITIPERTDRNGVKHPRYTICHYILTEGVINYCGDCPHEMKNQSIPLPDLPEDYRG